MLSILPLQEFCAHGSAVARVNDVGRVGPEQAVSSSVTQEDRHDKEKSVRKMNWGQELDMHDPSESIAQEYPSKGASW